MKKGISILLVLAIILSIGIGFPVESYAVDTGTITIAPVGSYTTSAEAQEITLKITPNVTANYDTFGISSGVEVPDGFKIKSYSTSNTAQAISTGDYNVNEGDIGTEYYGTLNYCDSNVEPNIPADTTYEVVLIAPANAEGIFSVTFRDVQILTDWSSTELLNEAAVEAQFTITAPDSGEDEPTEPEIPAPAFELSYTLDKETIAVGGNVTATVSLTSDVDCILQAYDVIVNADVALEFVSVDNRIESTTGGKADTDGTATEVRYVGEALNAPMTANTQVTLFTITYKLPTGAEVKDEQKLAITLETPEADNDSSASVGGTPEDFKPTVTGEALSVTVNQKQKITFTNGEDNKVEEVGYNTPYTLPTADSLGFENEGYTFEGWDIDGDGAADKQAGDELKVKVDTTIKAVWTINEYTITFNTDGGTAIDPITQDYGTPVTAPANPTKTGYTFAGWDAEIPATMPAENLIITATWTANEYTITFVDDNGTTVLQSGKVAYGEIPVYNGTPTKAETAEYTYTFKGWDKEIVAVTGDATYTATYTSTPKTYTITFDTDGGSSVAAITQGYGTEVNAPANPTKTGYTFAGWDKTVPTTMPAENVTIKAKWTINQYTITFDTDGGSDVAPIKQDYATEVNAPANPTKTGYTFAGWSTEIPATMPAENVTIKAQWTINQYTITFVDTGDVAYEPITQDYNTAVTAPANPTKAGYTFASWDKEIPATMPAENVTITANWTANTYTITFVVEDGLTAPDVTVTYGAGFNLPDLEKDGYNLLGWSKSSSAEAADYTVGRNTTDLTTDKGEIVKLYPVWGINQYTVTFKDWNGDTLGEVQTVDHGKAATAPANPTREGYTFTGWDTDFSNVTENLIVTAQYTINKYTITWIVDGKTTTETYEYGATPEFTGSTDKAADAQYTYTFTGWTPAIVAVTGTATYTAQYSQTVNKYTITWDVDGTKTTETYEYGATPSFKGSTDKAADTQYTYTFTDWNPAIVDVTGEATYTAQYSQTVNKYTITWDVDGTKTTETYEYGATPSFKGSTDKAADAQYTYTFKSWDKEIVAVTGDATYTATYDKTVNKYTITWIVDGNEITEEYEYGTNVVEPETPTKEGHTFKEWTPTIATTVTSDAIYTATWTINQYTITFKDGDTTLKSETLDYGADITAPADPTKEGHTFKGWSPAVAATVPAEDVTYEATWTVNKYKVTFEVDGEEVKSDTLDYGTAITAPADPTKTGYTFNGWSPTVDATVPANDATYTATWTAIQYTITYVNGNVRTPVDYTIEDTVKVEDLESKTNYTAQWTVTATDGGTDIGKWNATVEPGASLTGMYGNVTLTAEWIPDIVVAKVGYKYAHDSSNEVLFIVDASALNANGEYKEGAETYFISGAEMFYTEDENYIAKINAITGNEDCRAVFVYIANKNLGAEALSKGTATADHDLDVLKQKGDINGNKRTDISDANAVYQMLKEGGDYYSYAQLSVKARLIADMYTEDAPTGLGNANDALAILDIMDGNNN